MSTKHSISRREFLKVAATTGTGLVIGIYFPGCHNAPAPSPTSTSPKAPPGTTHTPELTAAQEPTPTPNPNASFEPNLYLRVDGTGAVTITVPRPELGQGVRTALAMIVAEELDADWSTVRVEQALADSRYGNQLVGGSRSIYESYYLLQKVGAVARAMLISAAALIWEVEQETCHTENGGVIHTPSGDVLTYADLVELAASKANWGEPMPDGWGRGIACWSTFNMTPVAHVVDVSVAQDGSIHVHRVVCAIDCGTVVNPNMVKEQMEGGIVFGLTAALKANITIENGRVQQSNFHDYPLLRMDEMPTVKVYIVPSDAPPLGVGEMGVPPTAPAVANAIYAATGKRIRKLPIRSEDLREL